MALRTVHRKVAVIGSYGSGKTVLLTSLINHLQYHDPQRFALNGHQTTLTSYKRVPLRASRRDQTFDYELCRQQLAAGTWPAKTMDVSYYRISLQPSNWRLHDLLLDFIDCPGERFADIDIAACEYDDWSDNLHRKLRLPSCGKVQASEYLSLQMQDRLTDQDFLRGYRRLLARFCKAYMPGVSPSTSVLNSAGELISCDGDEESIAQSMCSGLPGQEFAPMSEEARAKYPEIAKTFASHYRSYKKQAVSPLFDEIAGCDTFVILVDVLGILRAGHMMYNDVRNMLERLTNYCKSASLVRRGLTTIGEWLPHWMRPKRLERVIFVAPKSDLVPEDQRDNLKSLLEQMVRPLLDDGSYTGKCLNCSAVAASQPDILGRLQGRIMYEPDGTLRTPDQAIRELVADPVPETWPGTWHPGDYCFPDVFPEPLFAGRDDAPPPHLGLNDVFSLILKSDNH